MAEQQAGGMNGRDRVAVVAGLRTPFTKAGTALKSMRTVDLGTAVVKELVQRSELSPKEITLCVYGQVVPTLDWKLIDETGDEVPAGGTGELCVRGSVVIKGYLNRPEATAEGIPNGWFHTGDIANVDDDGFVFIVDRAKDMVLRGGENVYCSEVEAAIYEHPGVAEVAVFGVPDDRLGEIVGAAIVLAPGAKLSEDELRAELADRLAKFKIPERVWILNEALPRNANGKFVKRDLKAQLLGT